MNTLFILFLFKLVFSNTISEFKEYGIDNSDSQLDKVYPNIGRIGYHCEYLGTVQRRKPELKSENFIAIDRIPTFGHGVGSTTEEKQALLNESAYITNTATKGGTGTYDSIDQDGNLYLNSNLLHYENGTVRKVYKHYGAIGNYRGDVSDDEPAIIKRMNIHPHGYGYSITGLYAPPGEIISARFSKDDLNSFGEFRITIGQVLNNDKANDIKISKDFPRMPLLTNTFKLTPNLFPHKRCIGEQCEIANNNDDYYQIVDGQRVANTNYLKNVDYTNADYVFYAASFLGGPIYLRSNNGAKSYTITISGAVKYAHYIKGYTTKEEFDDNWKSTTPYFDFEVWQHGILHSGPKKQATAYNYEDFYKAGVYWEKVTGVSHQVPSNADIRCTINVMYEPFIAAGSAVAFSTIGTANCPESWLNYVLGYKKFLYESLGDVWGPHHEYNHHFQRGWAFTGDGEVSNNAVTLIAYSFYSKTSGSRNEAGVPAGDWWNRYTSASWVVSNAISGHNNNLCAHAVFIHCFGQFMFIEATNSCDERNSNKWYKTLSTVTGLDLSYFFLKVYKTITFDDTVIATYNTSEYKKFVPIASTYQTGVGYMVKGKRNEIHTMRPFRIKFGEDKILNFTKQMIVPDDIEFTIKSITQPEHGSIQKVSENIYKYHPDANHINSGKITMTIGLRNKEISDFPVDDVEMYLDFMQTHELRELYKNERILDRAIYVYNDGELPTDPVSAFQNNYANHIDYVDVPNNNSLQNSNSEIWYYPQEYFDNRIVELRGKTLVTPGKYRFAIRGRFSVALFISTDEGKNYELAGKKTTGDKAEFDLSNAETYHDYVFDTDTWVYFKAVLIQDKRPNTKPFIGVGMGKFDDEGNVVVQYLNNAYHQAFQPDPEFISKDIFPRIWTERHLYESKKGKLIKYSYIPWTSGVEAGKFDLEHLFDDDDSNIIHSAKEFPISENNPFSVTVDMGEVIEADSMTIYGPFESNYQYQPKKFKLYVGNDINDLHLAAEVTDSTRSGSNVLVSFSLTQFRYYQLNVTQTHAPNQQFNYISYRYITFARQFTGPCVSLDDDRVTLFNTWKKENKFCTFGNIYVGEFNSKAVFKFTGTSFAIKAFSSPEFGSFWVYIDGVKVKFIDLNTDFNRVYIVYKNYNLEDKEHVVTIRGFTKFNIDSFIIGQDLSSVDELVNEIFHDWEGIEPTATPLPTPVIPPPTPLASKSPTPHPTYSATPVQTETPTPLPLLPVNKTVLTNPEGLVNITCDKFEYTGWNTGGRGQICVQSGEADHGSFTRNTGAKATVKFIGTKFHILAWKQPNSGPAKIWVDDVLYGEPNFNSNTEGRYSDIAFTSPEFPYGEHTLVIEHAGSHDTQSVVFGSIYVDPVPSVGSFKDSYEEFKTIKGTWTQNTETTPPSFSCTDSQCEGEFDFFGTRFWLTGIRGSDVGEFKISIDGGEEILIQERQTASIAQNNLPVILYQSEQLRFSSHKVKIIKTSYKVSLVNIIYTLYPNTETPTQSPSPSQSIYPLLPPEESVLGNQEGLLNITCDKFEYTGWDTGGRGKICVQSSEADHGSFTRNTGAKAKVKFIGTRFHILAWKQENSGTAKIWVDDQFVGEPDFCSGNQNRFAEIAYTSPIFPYGEHTLVIEHSGTHNINSVILGSIYVDPLPNVGGFKLTHKDFKATKGVWSQSTSTIPSTFTCTNEECAGEFEFYGTRFWLSGVRGSDLGEFEITIDDGQPILIQERQTAGIAQNNLPVVLYQSDVLDFRPHKVKITKTSYDISLVNLMYTIYPHTQIPTPYPTQTPTPIPLLPIDQSVMTNQEGLVNITCDKFEYTGWDTGGRGQICVQSGEANHGSFTRNTGAKATVKFIGTKFHILAWKQENSGPAKIWVDNVLIGEPNFNSNTGGRLPGIAFTSPEFPYGEHTLVIEHTGSFNTQSVVFGSIYVDPLPDIGGFKLAYDDFKTTKGTWTQSTSTNPATFTCTDAECAGEFKFFGTRFWLTGVRGAEVGEFEITIDKEAPILIQERQTAEIAQNNLPVILYQSDELNFGQHTVKIRRTGYQISLCNLLYTLHPYTEIPTPSPVPLLPPDKSLMVNQDGLLNITCDKFEYTGWVDGNRGQICVQSGEANHGSFTRNTGAKAKIKFTGTRFHILAWKQQNSGPAKIWVDDILYGEPNFNSNTDGRYEDIAFTSPIFPYGEHTLVIEHTGAFNTQSVVFGSIYVDPLPDFGGFKLTYDDLVQKAGTWTKTTILNYNTPIISCTDSTCDGEFTFTGTKFYLTGVRGNNVGEFEIYIDDGQPILIQERQTADIAQNNSPVVLYQSDELEYKSHKVKIQRTQYDILLVNLLYTTHPWLPTDIIVDNDKLENERFDKVVVTNQTVSVTINVSTFTGVEHNENGGAIHVVNAAFKCEKVEFDECKSEEAGGAIYLSSTHDQDNSFILDGLTFDNCQAKFGGAVYIYSASKNNMAIVRNCIFTNNNAYLSKEYSEDGKYGGSAIFLTARNGLLDSNVLIGNKGDTAVKIYNHFDKEKGSNKLKILENDQEERFLISNCKFEISKESLSCLYYFLGNDASSFEIKGCSFTGKLNSNAHYIDGESINKLGPKMIVRSCRFAILDSNKAFNTKLMNEYLSVDLKDQVFEASDIYGKKDLFSNWKIIVAVVVPAALVATLAVLLVILLKRKNKNEVVQEFEMNSQSIPDIDESQNSQLNLPLL